MFVAASVVAHRIDGLHLSTQGLREPEFHEFGKIKMNGKRKSLPGAKRVTPPPLKRFLGYRLRETVSIFGVERDKPAPLAAQLEPFR